MKINMSDFERYEAQTLMLIGLFILIVIENNCSETKYS